MQSKFHVFAGYNYYPQRGLEKMHINKELAVWLIDKLQYFVEHGKLPIPETENS